MALTANEVVNRARAILTEKAPSTQFALPTLTALVPVALTNVAERILQSGSPDERRRLTVTTAAITIGAGNLVDIREAVSTAKIRFDSVQLADIVIVSNPNTNSTYAPTVELIDSLDRLLLGADYDNFVTLAYLDESILRFNPSLSGLEGLQFTISAPGIPSDLDLVDPTLMGDLALEVATLAQSREEANARGLSIGSQKT